MSKTALDLTSQEWQAYHPGEAGGTVARRAHATAEMERRRQARQVAHKAAQILRQQFGASKVVLFGSLARETCFSPWSDIDLAAWGISPERFYSAVAAITGLSAAFKIDLIDPQFCRSSLQEALDREGVVL